MKDSKTISAATKSTGYSAWKANIPHDRLNETVADTKLNNSSAKSTAVKIRPTSQHIIHREILKRPRYRHLQKKRSKDLAT